MVRLILSVSTDYLLCSIPLRDSSQQNRSEEVSHMAHRIKCIPSTESNKGPEKGICWVHLKDQ